MAISLDSRVWLATHLLYPNSSQAFDVYQTLLAQSESSIKKNNLNSIFQKLYQIVSKIPAISSNKSFHVFDEEKIAQWHQIYRKSQKEQLIVFVGYFIFDLELKDISGIIGLSFEKTQFLFYQTFKKATVLSIKGEVPDKVQLKKHNEEKVSFLFTNENLIDYCLKNLPPAEMKKVRYGLELYPELKTSQQQYDLIVEQMNYLTESQADRVTKTLIQTSETLSEPHETFQIDQIFVKHKAIAAAAAVSVGLLFVVLIRPNWIQSLTKTSRDRFIDLQEVKPRAQMADEEIQNVPIEASTEESITAAPVAVTSPETSKAKPIEFNHVELKIVPTLIPFSVVADKGLYHSTGWPIPPGVPSLSNSSSTNHHLGQAAKKPGGALSVTQSAAQQPADPSAAPDIQSATQLTKKSAQAATQPMQVEYALNHEPHPAEEKKAGGLYRGVLTVTDINEVSFKITQRLVEMGGKKAGEVELGWKKSNTLVYYHFTLPENNIETMKEFLEKFGQLQLQYENHPRLMPVGVKRLIIEVKERE